MMETDKFLFSEQFSKEGLTKYLMSDENAPILLDRLDIYQVRKFLIRFLFHFRIRVLPHIRTTLDQHKIYYNNRKEKVFFVEHLNTIRLAISDYNMRMYYPCN